MNSQGKRHRIIGEQDVRKFNAVRQRKKATPLSRKMLQKILKNMGYSSNTAFIRCMTMGNNPIIIHISYGNYAFRPTPICIVELQRAWDHYINYVNCRKLNKL